jgi:hypothetical protein
MTSAVVGVANHNGWAHFITVAWTDEEPVVVDRRRVALVTDDVPKQPHEHHARELSKPEAQALVDRVRRSAADHAHAALATLRDELAPVLTLRAMAMRRSQFGELPADIGEILDYPPFRYAADSMLYLEALDEAATSLGLTVVRHPKGEEFARAGARLGLDAAETEAWLRDLGAKLGPPWTEEHRRAAAAAVAIELVRD